MAKEKKNSSNTPEWYKSPWSKTVGVISGIFLIFGAGFSAGKYYYETKSNLEKISMTQDFNKQLSGERERYQKQFEEIYKQKIDNLETVVNEIAKKKHEK